MPSQNLFHSGSPTCGRSLERSSANLGRSVACRHVEVEFVAVDPADGKLPDDSGIALLKRADARCSRPCAPVKRARRTGEVASALREVASTNGVVAFPFYAWATAVVLAQRLLCF